MSSWRGYENLSDSHTWHGPAWTFPVLILNVFRDGYSPIAGLSAGVETYGVPAILVCEKLNGDRAKAACYFWTIPGHGTGQHWSLDAGNVWIAAPNHLYDAYNHWIKGTYADYQWKLIAPSGVPRAYWDDPNMEEGY